MFEMGARNVPLTKEVQLPQDILPGHPRDPHLLPQRGRTHIQGSTAQTHASESLFKKLREKRKTKPRLHPSEQAILTLKDIYSNPYTVFLNFQCERMLTKSHKAEHKMTEYKTSFPHSPPKTMIKILTERDSLICVSPTKSRKISGKAEGYNKKAQHIFLTGV